MPAIETLAREAVSLKLNAGQNQSGSGIVQRSVTVGKFSANADKDKIMNIVQALLPVLSHSLVKIERTKVYVLEAGV